MPVEFVDRELAELARLGTVRSLIFTDDTFNVPLGRFKLREDETPPANAALSEHENASLRGSGRLLLRNPHA